MGNLLVQFDDRANDVQIVDPVDDAIAPYSIGAVTVEFAG